MRSSSAWYSSGVSDRNLLSLLRSASPAASPASEPAEAETFGKPAAGGIGIGIYDVAGRRVCTLLKGTAQAGMASARWDGRDDSGRAVASGIYFARMAAAGTVRMARIVLVR